MYIGHCIGRRRVCSFCGHKFTDTDEAVFAEEDSDEILLCRLGDSSSDQSICVNGWRASHPGFFFNFTAQKLADVQAYFTWPPDLAPVR